MSKATRTPIGCLDHPSEHLVVHGLRPALGWAATSGLRSTTVELLIDGERIDVEIERVPRPDVQAAFPWAREAEPVGFQAVINWTLYDNGPHVLSCVARSGLEKAVLQSAEVRVENSDLDRFYRRIFTGVDRARQESRLRELIQILACQECRGPLSRETAERLSCTCCGSEYPLLGAVPVTVRGGPEYPVEESRLKSPSSNHQYPDPILTKLEETLQAGGVALDLGAGRKTFGAPALIQLEICNYPFTDIVNQSEELPFLDDTFDLVVSLAVTEHVKRPWILASEIQRVTKPGGEVFVDSAFLQPLHGYPSHYFNMTAAALGGLFPGMEVLSLAPAPYQHPWFVIRWILSSLVSSLNEGDRSRLGGMTVDQLLKEVSRFCTRDGEGSLAEVRLKVETIAELAAGFTLHGRKV